MSTRDLSEHSDRDGFELQRESSSHQGPPGHSGPGQGQGRGSGAKKVKQQTHVEAYDQELLTDIEALCSFAIKARDTRGPIDDVLVVEDFLTQMAALYKSCPFRVFSQRSIWLDDRVVTVIVTDSGASVLDTRPLNDGERTEYLGLWSSSRAVNFPALQIPVHKLYPNAGLMNFVQGVLAKYGAKRMFTTDQYTDDAMKSCWHRVLEGDGAR